jgi:hypothetical protein
MFFISFNAYSVNCQKSGIEEIVLGTQKPIDYIEPEDKIFEFFDAKVFELHKRDIERYYLKNNISLDCFFDNFPELNNDLNNLQMKHLQSADKSIESLLEESKNKKCTQPSNLSAEMKAPFEALFYYLDVGLSRKTLLSFCKEQLKASKNSADKNCLKYLEDSGYFVSENNSGMGMVMNDRDFYANNQYVTSPKSFPQIFQDKNTIQFFYNLNSQNISDAASQKKITEIKNELEKDFKNVSIVSFGETGLRDNKATRMVISYDDNNCTYTYISGGPEAVGSHLFGRHIHCKNDPQTGKELEKPIQFLLDFEIKDPNFELVNRKNTEKCIECHTRGPILFMSPVINYGSKSEVDAINKKLRDLPVANFVSWDEKQSEYIDAFRPQKKRAHEIFGPMFNWDDPLVNQRISESIPPGTESLGLKQVDIIKAVKSSVSCSECHNPNYLGNLRKDDGFNYIHLRSYILSEDFNKDHERFIKGDNYSPEQKQLLNHVLMNYLGLSSVKVPAFDFLETMIKPEWQISPKTAIYDASLFSCPNIEDNQKAYFSDQSVLQLFKPGELSPEFNKDAYLNMCQNPNLLKDIKDMNTYRIPEWKKDNPFDNTKIICKENGDFHYPIKGTPGCTGTCSPYDTTLKFNSQGDFLNFTNEDCEYCSFGLKKYDPQDLSEHKQLSPQELRDLEYFYKNNMLNYPEMFMADNKYFVDAYSGATLVDHFPFQGAGLMISDLGKYISLASTYIKTVLKDTCQKK